MPSCLDFFCAVTPKSKEWKQLRLFFGTGGNASEVFLDKISYICVHNIVYSWLLLTYFHDIFLCWSVYYIRYFLNSTFPAFLSQLSRSFKNKLIYLKYFSLPVLLLPEEWVGDDETQVKAGFTTLHLTSVYTRGPSMHYFNIGWAGGVHKLPSSTVAGFTTLHLTSVYTRGAVHALF